MFYEIFPYSICSYNNNKKYKEINYNPLFRIMMFSCFFFLSYHQSSCRFMLISSTLLFILSLSLYENRITFYFSIQLDDQKERIQIHPNDAMRILSDDHQEKEKRGVGKQEGKFYVNVQTSHSLILPFPFFPPLFIP